MLTQFKSMWDGHVSLIEPLQHRIELQHSKDFSLHSTPYRGTAKAREFETQELDRMLAMDMIEPPEAEWVSPIGSGQRKMAAFASVSTTKN